MSGLLPLVRGSVTALYPVTRRVTFWTDVAIAADASEQRSKQRPPLTEITLPYSRVKSSDLALFQNFFASQKGEFDKSWGMVLGGAALDGAITSGSTSLVCASGPFTSSVTGQQFVVSGAGPSGGLLVTTGTYVSPTQVTLAAAASTTVSGADTRWGIYLPNLTLLDSQFSAREENATRTTYNFTIHARQVMNPGQASGSSSAFPTLASGATTQFPYVATRRFAVVVNDNPSGMRYSWSLYDGTASFPSGALHGWEVSLTNGSNADVALWETFARNQFGRFGQFSFTDPDTAVTYSKCRLDTDVIEIQHKDYQANSLTLRILETN
jgi:hypothetical protein